MATSALGVTSMVREDLDGSARPRIRETGVRPVGQAVLPFVIFVTVPPLAISLNIAARTRGLSSTMC